MEYIINDTINSLYCRKNAIKSEHKWKMCNPNPRFRVRVRCPWPILLYCRLDILKFVVKLHLYKLFNKKKEVRLGLAGRDTTLNPEMYIRTLLAFLRT